MWMILVTQEVTQEEVMSWLMLASVEKEEKIFELVLEEPVRKKLILKRQMVREHWRWMKSLFLLLFLVLKTIL